MTAHDHVAFLAGSPNRVRVLRAIYDEPARQCVLIDRLELSRSTVQRCLRGLTKRGWSHKDDGEFRITPGGAHVLFQYDALTDTINAVEDHAELLVHLRDLAFSLPPGVFTDATVVSASSAKPHAPESHLTELLDTAGVERFRAISPTVSDVFNEAATTMVEAGTDMELILDTTGFEVSRTEYTDALADAYAADAFDLYVHPEEFGFGLVIADDRVLVTVYDDAERIRGCLEDSADPLVTWAGEVYETYRHEATLSEVSAA